MTDSIPAETAGKPGFTRRRFIIGSAGVSAIAALGGTTVRAARLRGDRAERPAHHHAPAADHDHA
jgi:hypothetical protein